jgi:hypothetical protein
MISAVTKHTGYPQFVAVDADTKVVDLESSFKAGCSCCWLSSYRSLWLPESLIIAEYTVGANQENETINSPCVSILQYLTSI